MLGMKWSAMYTPSHPASSSAVTSSAITFHGWAALGQIDNLTGSSPQMARATYFAKMRSSERTVCSIAKPLRSISGSSSQV